MLQIDFFMKVFLATMIVFGVTTIFLVITFGVIAVILYLSGSRKKKESQVLIDKVKKMEAEWRNGNE